MHALNGPASSIPPHLPPLLPSHRATVRVDLARRWPRLVVVWDTHPPLAVMRAAQHQLAALAWAASVGKPWDVVTVEGAMRGSLPFVGVELVLDSAGREADRDAVCVLEQVAKTLEG